MRFAERAEQPKICRRTERQRRAREQARSPPQTREAPYGLVVLLARRRLLGRGSVPCGEYYCSGYSG
jgi:hypothetical protein